MKQPLLTVLVPVYNEEKLLSSAIYRINQSLPDAEIVFINDGSTDRSLEILNTHARTQDVIVNAQHEGKGAAIAKGLAVANGIFTVIQDADLEYDPSQIAALLEVAMTNRGAAIFGTRFKQTNPTRYHLYHYGNKTITMLINVLFGAHITDSYTCYKLMPTILFRSLNIVSNGFEIESEICCKCLARGIPIIEVPVAYVPRSIEDGKKINLIDAVKGCLMILKLRFMRK